MTTSSATGTSSKGWPPPSSHDASQAAARRPVPRPGDYLNLAGAALDVAPEALFATTDLGLAESAL